MTPVGFDVMADSYCGLALARSIAVDLSVEPTVALEALHGLPENLRPLLSSPEGWLALGQYVAAALGADVAPRQPTVH